MTNTTSVQPPSAVTTTTRAVPSPTAVSSPRRSTVTTPSSSVMNVRPRSVAFSGISAGARRSLSPTCIVSDSAASVTPVTATGATVTVQDALRTAEGIGGDRRRAGSAALDRAVGLYGGDRRVGAVEQHQRARARRQRFRAQLCAGPALDGDGRRVQPRRFRHCGHGAAHAVERILARAAAVRRHAHEVAAAGFQRRAQGCRAGGQRFRFRQQCSALVEQPQPQRAVAFRRRREDRRAVAHRVHSVPVDVAGAGDQLGVAAAVGQLDGHAPAAAQRLARHLQTPASRAGERQRVRRAGVQAAADHAHRSLALCNDLVPEPELRARRRVAALRQHVHAVVRVGLRRERERLRRLRERHLHQRARLQPPRPHPRTRQARRTAGPTRSAASARAPQGAGASVSWRHLREVRFVGGNAQGTLSPEDPCSRG